MHKQKPVLITGCSSGIGLCLARGLHARGYQVFATVRQQQDMAQLASEGLQVLQLDLTDSQSINNAVDQVLKDTGGHLYGLINNGGYQQPGALEDLSRQALRAQFETNLFGAHELICKVLPAMRHQGQGRIIQISSILGLISLPYRGAYNASKYALEGLSDTLRLELHGSGVQVALIEPGPITSRLRENAHRRFVENIVKETSAHRERYKGLEQRLTRSGSKAPFALPPEAVLKKTIQALESEHCAPRYYVTFPTYLFGNLRRLLSSAWLDRLLLKVAGKENSPTE